ncbi:MAG: metallopeptidase TldD-related protein [Candidatus Kapabacteria bacterium]|nr:metallopeptidase TldD-related protein [Candidatus Kapabacteria bacterium]
MRRNSGNNITKIVFIIILFFSSRAFLFTQDNEIFRAMQDELQRSMNELKIENLQKPYYIEYTLKIKQSHEIKSFLGSITEKTSPKIANLSVGVRVGDYKFDNTNFFDFGMSFFGSGDEEESFRNRRIPIELDYKTIRRELWLATDAAYKQVSETFAKKQSVLKTRLINDTTHDFIRLEPEKLSDIKKIPEFDSKKFENYVKRISNIFKRYPEFTSSIALVEYIPETTYYINSEGRQYIKTDFYAGIELAVTTQADDGMPLSSFYTCILKEPNDIPSLDSLERAAKAIADNLQQLRMQKTLEEAYSGPIIFEGQAAAEIFAQVFAPNLVTQREPLTETGKQTSDRFMAFQTKIGGRVLPEFLSLKATPTKEKAYGVPLVGSYKIDDDGVLAQDVELVKDGFLKNLLSSRVPTKRVRTTNGHQRGGAAMISVLELESDEKHSLTRSELKNKLIQLCKDRELPFGIIVRRMFNQNVQLTTLFQLNPGDFSFSFGGGSQPKQPLIEVYKVYPDGKEELIRGCEAKGFTQQTFKDILNVGKEKYVLNYLAPAITSPFMSGGSQYLASTVIVPDLLFEDGEITPVEQDFPKPPIIKNPLTEKK